MTLVLKSNSFFSGSFYDIHLNKVASEGGTIMDLVKLKRITEYLSDNNLSSKNIVSITGAGLGVTSQDFKISKYYSIFGRQGDVVKTTPIGFNLHTANGFSATRSAISASNQIKSEDSFTFDSSLTLITLHEKSEQSTYNELAVSQVLSNDKQFSIQITRTNSSDTYKVSSSWGSSGISFIPTKTVSAIGVHVDSGNISLFNGGALIGESTGNVTKDKLSHAPVGTVGGTTAPADGRFVLTVIAKDMTEQQTKDLTEFLGNLYN